MLRPALALALGTLVTSCSGAEGDANRFESMARQVADIPLDGREREPTAAELGLRPALASAPPAAVVKASTAGLKIEVMDPHDLWDARDGLRRPFPKNADAGAAPTIAVSAPRALSAPARAVPGDFAAPRPAAVSTTIQLGAYSSMEIARAAWTDARAASGALRTLTPDFVPVEVNGKPFVRLRVKAPVADKAAICRALEIADPWCLRGV